MSQRNLVNGLNVRLRPFVRVPSPSFCLVCYTRHPLLSQARRSAHHLVRDVVWMSFGCRLNVVWMSFGCRLDVVRSSRGIFLAASRPTSTSNGCGCSVLMPVDYANWWAM